VIVWQLGFSLLCEYRSGFSVLCNYFSPVQAFLIIMLLVLCAGIFIALKYCVLDQQRDYTRAVFSGKDVSTTLKRDFLTSSAEEVYAETL
jgi:hypothetical protein